MLTTIGLSVAGGLCLLVVLLVLALAILPKKNVAQIVSPIHQPIFHEPLHMAPAFSEPVRMRSQWEIETDEDIDVIADTYRTSRKADRAAVALERLSRITSVPSSGKAPKQQ